MTDEPIVDHRLLDAAQELRTAAADAYERRAEHLDALAKLVDAGVWRGEDVRAAVAEGRRDRALLRMRMWEFIEAAGGGNDLPLDYRPLLLPGRPPREADLDGAEGFLDKLRPRDTDTELWLRALELEARAYLSQLRGDRALREAERLADRAVKQLLARVDRLRADDLRRMAAYIHALRVYRRLYLPWRVESLYRRFLGRFPIPDPVADLIAKLEADFDSVPRELFDAWGAVADAALPALEMRNPADPTEVDALRRLSPPLEAIAEGRAEEAVVAVEHVAAEVFRKSGRNLRAVLRAVPEDSRAAMVLKAWQGLAFLGLGDFRGLFALLDGVQPDDEAQGILTRALRGEARYRLGKFEDAYLDLLRAERMAAAAIARGGATPNAAERDALRRLAQKAGNALLAIGDEAKADEAFARAREYDAEDPAGRAVDLINRGNLLLLRNALDREQGYMTVDRTWRKRLVDEGPAALDAERARRHAESLDGAEGMFRQALAAVEGASGGTALGAGASGVRPYLVALCHLNLGNVAWARRRAGGQRLAKASLEEAREHYEAALDAARKAGRGEARGVVGAARGNLTEVRILLAEGEPQALRAALKDAQAALAAAERDALNPDLLWQAHFNLARIRQGLGEREAAGEAYRAAIAVVEAQRAAVRSDAWQASLLRDRMEVYEGYLGFLFEGAEAGRVEAMFDLLERMRARAFLELLRRAQVDVALPEELKAEADALLGRIAAGNEALRAATLADDEKAAARLVREQAGFARQWADLQAQMLAAQGADKQLNPPRITLAETQARLRGDARALAHTPGSAPSGGEGGLLLFQLGEDASYLLVVTADAAEAHRLPPRREIELLALPVIFDCSFGDANAAARFARNNVALSRALLGPLGAELLRGKRVVIAPDGVLCYLPFEVLFPEPDAAEALAVASYADLKGRYLLDAADVSYAPSSSAWRELSDRPKRAPTSSLFAVYDVRYDTGDPPVWAFPILMKLDSVPGASDVRKAIAFAQQAWPDLPVEQLRARRDDDSPEDAARQPTEENFLRVAPLAAARFVVFNGHATYNDKHPNLSGLVFNLARPSEPDAAEIPADNFLRVDELFRLELPAAEVTFLAACQTALGAPYRGEGLNALLRAFMYRGSPAVVATLWAVDANAASWLVRRFFKLLAENPGEDPARLFNQAKRGSIGFDNRWLPFHWAPFIYAGAHGRGDRRDAMSEARRIVMLSVGVGDYANPKVNDLKLTTADARDMAATFTRLARSEAHVRLLLDAAATKAGIKAGIDWLAQTVAEDDLAVFYYSGHGARYRDQDSDEPDAFDEFLCPQDTGVGGGVETFIRDDEMRLWLQAVTGKTRNLAVIFDCCHSGSAVLVGGATAREIPRETVEEMLEGYKRPPDKPTGIAGQGPLRGHMLLAAAQDHQSSFELRGMKNGLFTTYLLEALAGGEVKSFYELFKYAARKVGEDAVKHNLQQTPNLIERAEGDLAVG